MADQDPDHFLEPFQTPSCAGCRLYPRSTYTDHRNKVACFQATNTWQTREGGRDWEARGRPRITGNPENQPGHGMAMDCVEYESDSPGFVEVEVTEDLHYVPPSVLSLFQDSALTGPSPDQRLTEGLTSGQIELDGSQAAVLLSSSQMAETQSSFPHQPGFLMQVSCGSFCHPWINHWSRD